MISHDLAKNVVKEAYEKGRIMGKIEAYKEMEELIIFYTEAAVKAIDAEIEELRKNSCD